jgi:hypothetical protein|nr:MAG TPA: HK97 Family Phage Portal Protein [Caudoviricetes sp.]
MDSRTGPLLVPLSNIDFMRQVQIKSAPQFRVLNWRSYKIQSYGEDNDFPQAIDEIVRASKTGTACLSIYNDFVYGHGFRDRGIGDVVADFDGHKLDELLLAVCDDFTRWHGFALHVNYNENFKVRTISHIPFECLRLGNEDEDGNVSSVVYHPDWGRRDERRAWTQWKIERFALFDPSPEIIMSQVNAAGGWDGYNGQVLYYSGESMDALRYPVPIYIAEITDMRTEEGLANVTGRNVCSNFLTAGILVDIKEEEQNEEQLQKKQKELEAFQGDENASQLWYHQVKNKDHIPEFIKFSGENYDKSFTATQASVPENIGQAFKQPPILRAVNVGANFGADLMTNAYAYYNSVTVRERRQISEVFRKVFTYWWMPLDEPDFTIQPLTYNAGFSIADRVGDNMDKVLEVMRDATLTVVQKRNILKLGYGLHDDEVLKLVPDTNI